MLTLLLIFVAAVPAGYFSYTAGEGGHWGWAILAVLAACAVVALPINLWVKKRLTDIFQRVQKLLQDMQDSLRHKATAFQNRGMVGPQAMAQLKKEQEEATKKALPILDEAKSLRIWNRLAAKQADIFKGQLLFQLGEYDKARPLLQTSLVMDPLLLCMQMVLVYRENPEEQKKIFKLYHQGLGRFKYEKAKLIYALYSWILVKQNRVGEAVAILEEAKKKTEDPVLTQNWEHLANGRLRRFSNEGLGEQWYALGLEEPRPVRQTQQTTAFGGRLPRGGFRR